MTYSNTNPPARPHCVLALFLTCTLVFAFACSRTTNTATDTPQPTNSSRAPAATGAPQALTDTNTPQSPATPAAAQTIEAAFAALEPYKGGGIPTKEFDKIGEDYGKMTPDRKTQFWDQHHQAVTEKAFAIFNTHKDDPRRWNVVPFLFKNQPEFYKSVTLPNVAPEEAGKSLLEKDPDKKKEHEARLAEIRASLAAATDVPADVREFMAHRDLSNKLDAAWADARKTPAPPIDFAALRTAVDTFLADWPDSRNGFWIIANSYISFVKHTQGTPETEILNTFAQSPNRYVKKYVQDRFAFLEIVKNPIEMTFTAADGRKVDGFGMS